MSAKMTTNIIVTEESNGKNLTEILTSKHCTEKEELSNIILIKSDSDDENLSNSKDAPIPGKEIITPCMASATDSKILANIEKDSTVDESVTLSTNPEPQIDSQKSNNALKLTVNLSSNVAKLENELKDAKGPENSKAGYNFNFANLDQPNAKFTNVEECDGVFEFDANESFCENNKFEESFSYTSFLDNTPVVSSKIVARDDESSPPKKKVCLNTEADSSEKYKKDMDACELSDMANPNWKKLRDEKPEKWFEVVHKQWRSSEIPDPHKNLTVRYQNKTWKQMKGIFAKKHLTRGGDALLVKHFYNNQIEDLYKHIDFLRKEMDRLYFMKRRHNRMYCNHRMEALSLEEQQCKDAIKNYKYSIDELEYVLSFYQQGVILTEYMQSEAERQFVMRDRMNKYYGYS